MGSGERRKLIVVIGLAIILVATGYFRLFHGKATFRVQPARPAALPAAAAVPAVDLKGFMPAERPNRIPPEGLRARLRDIFAPPKAPVVEVPPAVTAAPPPKALPPPPPPLPSLQLTGTIIGGKTPLAVVNGKFLRKGERIEGFEVVSITGEQVILAGAGRRVQLHILTGTEELLP